MSQSIADTPERARDDIRRLRRDRGVDGSGLRPSAIVDSLDESLRILFDHLYHTPTRFLLELIQNADDNTFQADVTPRFALNLYANGGGSWYFRTDCNEVGFTFQQIDALAGVGHSTKSSPIGGARGYIGEKGIGFKSIFTVANVVQISSGYYEFMFDRTQVIGMILPVPAPFPPEQRNFGHTQFLLQLRDRQCYQYIQSDLENMQPELLIFLRKLKKLDIAYDSVQRHHRIESNQDDSVLGGETVEVITRQWLTEWRTKYVVVRYWAQNLPQEEQRLGIHTSEVVLAFPVLDNANPEIRSQMAFAFLPIADFGFKFLIQADFLLTANRESVESSSPWNDALHAGLQNAFVAAIQRFALMPTLQGQGLCYTWPKYLPRERRNFPFWDTLHNNMVHNLRLLPLLKCRGPDIDLKVPSSLCYVPQQFRYGDTVLFDCHGIGVNQLAFNYDQVHEELAILGVRTMTLDDLSRDFAQWVATEGDRGLQLKPEAWHVAVASIFCNIDSTLDLLKTLPIIPLADGRWVPATTPRLYLASPNQNEHVPRGANLMIVDQTACRNPNRHLFFQSLGIQAYRPEQVCNLIVDNSPLKSFFRSWCC